MCMKWCRDSKLLFSSGVSGVIHAWDIAAAMQQTEGPGSRGRSEKYIMGGPNGYGGLVENAHEDMVLDLLTIPSLDYLASASMDCTIRLWGERKNPIFYWLALTKPVLTLGISFGKQPLNLGLADGKHKRVLKGHTKGVRSLAYSPDYRFLVSGGFFITILKNLL